MKRAICQVADCGPLESLVVMLRAVGYDVYLPDERLKRQLRDLGCDTVLDLEGLARGWGYEFPMALPLAGPEAMAWCDLYVDVKAHRNGPLIWKQWPHLQNKTLWYRINGGAPEHVIKPDGFDCGDEVNPPCPVLTPNQCYKESGPWSDKAYVCWPPFYRFKDYHDRRGRHGFSKDFQPPVCLIHNLAGWGYGKLGDGMRALGVRLLGAGSPDGLVQHRDIPSLLYVAKAMVHLKSSDAPGYAIYEAMAAGCPVICTRRLIWRCEMQDLLEPGVTCLTFDRIGHQELTDQDVVECLNEVRSHLEALSDPAYNREIGMAGYERLKHVMWSKDSTHDVQTLNDFMGRWFS